MVHSAFASTLYVDCAWGNNGYDGSTNVVVLGTNHGPKLNITGALSAASSGDVLRVAAGFYQESDWDLGSKDLTLLPEGPVTIYGTDPWTTDTDGDGLPDAWEVKYGLDAFSADGVNGATGDADSDGINNLDEYLAGTNPQNADNTPPTITHTVTPTPNSAGWNTNDVVVHFTASDAGSGLATVLALDERGWSIGTPDGTGGVYVSFATETNVEVIGIAVDVAGNQAATFVTVNIDKTPPELTLDPGQGQTNDLSNPLLIVEYNDTNGLASAGLNLETLRITLDGEDVTTNFFRFETGAIGDGSALEAGTHTWSASITDYAGNVTTVSNTFIATGEINPDAPQITELNLDGITVLPDVSEVYVEGTIVGGSDGSSSSMRQSLQSSVSSVPCSPYAEAYASVNGGKAKPMMVNNCKFWGWLPVDPGTNVIVVTIGTCPLKMPETWIPCTPLTSRAIVVDVAKYLRVDLNAPLEEFSIGATQTVSGVMSWTAEAPWPWGTPIASVTLIVGGVSIPTTWSTNDNSLSFSAEFPTPCDPVPVKLKICWEGGYCKDIPLGLKEGYEVVQRVTEQMESYVGAAVSGNCNPHEGSWQAYGANITRRSSWFVAPCNGITNNMLDRIDAGYGFDQCFPDMPEWSEFGYLWEYDWWSNTNTVYLPGRGLVVGQWHEKDSGGDYVTYHVENDTGSLTFRAPTKYGPNTTVVLTFEDLSYEAYGMGMDWRQIKLKWNGTTHDPVEPGGYLVKVDGGKKYTVDASTFEWPTITTNILYGTHVQTVTIHRLSFSGFHNAKAKRLCACSNVKSGDPGTSGTAGIYAGHANIFLYDPNNNAATSYGLWPDDHPGIRAAGLSNGPGSDIRVNFSLDNPANYRYWHCEAITPQMEQTLASAVSQNATWTLIYNCSSFASDTFTKVTGATINALDVITMNPLVTIDNPRTFGSSIFMLNGKKPRNLTSAPAAPGPDPGTSSFP